MSARLNGEKRPAGSSASTVTASATAPTASAEASKALERKRCRRHIDHDLSTLGGANLELSEPNRLVEQSALAGDLVERNIT